MKYVEPTKLYQFESVAPVSFPSVGFNSNVLVPATYYANTENYKYSGPFLMAQDRGGFKESYVYRRSKVSAIAKNAAIEDIAYSSFETDEIPEGGWDQGGIFPTAGLSFTGRASCGGTINLMKTLDPNKTYEISFRTKATSMPTLDFLNGSSTNTYQSYGVDDGWKLMKAEFTGKTKARLYCSGEIDELRLLPKGATMQTVVHDQFANAPLSVCDENGNAVHVEYDALGRKYMTRDQNRNILEKYSYGINSLD